MAVARPTLHFSQLLDVGLAVAGPVQGPLPVFTLDEFLLVARTLGVLMKADPQVSVRRLTDPHAPTGKLLECSRIAGLALLL